MAFDIIISYLRDLNIITIIIRLVLALLLGGLIGYERGKRRRAAGFRTHILVSLGATMATLIGQFVFINISSESDPLRLAAQVVSGIGFLGVGTILITGRNQVRGLTTAAGLWSTATIGLALGIGFYEAAFICSALILFSIIFLQKVDNKIFSKNTDMDIYLEINDLHSLKNVITVIKEKGYNLHNIKITTSRSNLHNAVGLEGSINATGSQLKADMMNDISEIEEIVFITEIS